jgi:hypothetical protein
MLFSSTTQTSPASTAADLRVAQEANRNCDILAMLIIPWVLWLFVSWPDTPLGAVDAWIYRGFAQSLKMSYYLYPDFYYSCRFYVLMPEWVLNHIVPARFAHLIVAFSYCYGTLLGMYDFATSLGATARTRTMLGLLAATSLFLLRSCGWGYIDGFVMAALSLGMACMARSLNAGRPGPRCAWAAGGGAFLLAMVITHAMAAILGIMLLWFFFFYTVSLHRRSLLSRLLQTSASMLAGGALGLLSVCLVAQWRFHHFLFFMPIIKTTIFLSKTVSGFKVPISIWSTRADWLLIQCVGFFGSAIYLALGMFRAIRLSRFEVFAYVNAVGLLGATAFLEYYTSNVFLQYSYYSSYFLPASFLAIAAMFGENTQERLRLRWKVPLALLLILIAILSISAKQPFFQNVTTPAGSQGRPGPLVVNVFYIQLGLGCAGLLVLILARFDPVGSLATFVAALILCGMATVPPISHYPSPVSPDEVETSHTISATQQTLQKLIGTEHPLFWYSKASPFYWEFSSIHAAYLWWPTRVNWAFPSGPLSPMHDASTSVVEYTQKPWTGNERIVILTEHPDQMAQARLTFETVGMDLVVTDQFHVPRGDGGYWAILALTKPLTGPREFYAENLPSAIPNSLLLDQPGTLHKIRDTHAAGYLTFGPYAPLTPGNYLIRFFIACDGAAPPDDDVATVDVYSSASKLPSLASRTINAHDFGLPHTFKSFALKLTLGSEIPDAEFRVATTGKRDVQLQSITLERTGP